MTKLNSNGGDDKVDELLKERYDLAKDRIVEICTETTYWKEMKKSFP